MVSFLEQYFLYRRHRHTYSSNQVVPHRERYAKSLLLERREETRLHPASCGVMSRRMSRQRRVTSRVGYRVSRVARTLNKRMQSVETQLCSGPR